MRQAGDISSLRPKDKIKLETRALEIMTDVSRRSMLLFLYHSLRLVKAHRPPASGYGEAEVEVTDCASMTDRKGAN